MMPLRTKPPRLDMLCRYYNSLLFGRLVIVFSVLWSKFGPLVFYLFGPLDLVLGPSLPLFAILQNLHQIGFVTFCHTESDATLEKVISITEVVKIREKNCYRTDVKV